MTPISKELLAQIFSAATDAARPSSLSKINRTDAHKMIVEAVTPWAIKFDQAKKALEEIKSIVDRHNVPPMLHLQDIIKDYLASWKEEGKEGKAVQDIGKYQFLYWLEEDDRNDDPRELVISANSIDEAIDKFIVDKPDDVAKVDYEVGFNGDYIDISDSGLKRYI